MEFEIYCESVSLQFTAPALRWAAKVCVGRRHTQLEKAAFHPEG